MSLKNAVIWMVLMMVLSIPESSACKVIPFSFFVFFFFSCVT